MTAGQEVETETEGLSVIRLCVPFAQAFDEYSAMPELPEVMGSHSLLALAKPIGAHPMEEMVAMFPQRLQSLAPVNELNPLFNKGVELW